MTFRFGKIHRRCKDAYRISLVSGWNGGGEMRESATCRELLSKEEHVEKVNEYTSEVPVRHPA